MCENGAKRGVLVTRPAEDAAALVAALESRNLEIVLSPLLTIEFVAGDPPCLEGIQAILFTSANGVRAYGARGGAAALPVYAVGDATAAAAKTLGFAAVESADGDVADLTRLITARCGPQDGALLHVAGSKLAGVMGTELENDGFVYRREVLYRARKAESLSPDCRDALAAQKIDFALFYSPRTAESFATLAAREGVAEALKSVAVICLSDAVAASASRLPWRRIAVAEKPTQDELLAALDGQLECVSE